MIQGGERVGSAELVEESFHCDLEKCHGNCCVFGDSEAPIEKNEAVSSQSYPQSVSYALFEGKNNLSFATINICCHCFTDLNSYLSIVRLWEKLNICE
jgi:hypothetical protein